MPFFSLLVKCERTEARHEPASITIYIVVSFSGCVLPCWHLLSAASWLHHGAAGPMSNDTVASVGRGLLPICVHMKPIIFEQTLMELVPGSNYLREGNVTKIPCILKRFQTVGLMIKGQQKTC